MDLNFNKREDENKLALSDLRRKIAKIHQGGGEKKIEKLHAKGKLTARERIDYLLDDDAESIEIGTFAGYEMYPEHGGCPAGGRGGKDRLCFGQAMCGSSQRCHRESGCVVPDYGQEEFACARNCDGKPIADYLFGRQCRCLSTHAR